MNVGIYIYDQAEVLDFSGPFEVFSTASRVCKHANPFNVFLISESGETVTARAGYRVLPDFTIDNHPPLDVLIVVGGVHDDEMNKPHVINWINQQATTTQITASVCTGAFLLAKAHIITNHNVTTHWGDAKILQNLFPQLNVIHDVRWVDEGNIVTSGGISAGIDMSLYLVSKLTDEALAQQTAKQMDFSWTKNA